MRNRDFTQWFIDELAKENINFVVRYSSYGDELEIVLFGKDTTMEVYKVESKLGLHGMIVTYNRIMKFIAENGEKL